MLDTQREEYIESWLPDFRLRSYNYRNGPVSERPCRDVCCIVVGALLLGSFVALGCYTIFEGTRMWQKAVQDNQSIPPILLDRNPIASTLATSLGTTAIAIGAMIALSALSSIVYAWLMLRFPRCMVFTVIILVGIMLAGIAACCFVYNGNAVGMIVVVMFVVWVLVISCCYRRYITATITLAKIAAHFITQRPETLAASAIMLTCALVAGLFWATQMIGIVFIADQAAWNLNLPQGLYAISTLLFLYVIFWVGYAQAFLTASYVAHWYYKTPCPWWVPFKHLICAHLGSVTFASLIIIVIKLVKALSSPTKRDDNTCKKVCRCLFHCSLSLLEGFVHSMNHYSLIMCTLEGDSFVSGAKSAGVLYYSYSSSFGVINLVDTFFSWVGLFVCVGMPMVAGVLTLDLLGLGPISSVVAAIGGLAAVLACTSLVQTFSETACSVFLFFCLDKRLGDGRSSETSAELVELFKSAL